jgi:hypothetical protein
MLDWGFMGLNICPMITRANPSVSQCQGFLTVFSNESTNGALRAIGACGLPDHAEKLTVIHLTG